MSPWIFLLLLSEASTSNAYYKSTSNAPEENLRSAAAQKWIAADKVLRDVSSLVVMNVLPHVLQASETLNLTSGCSRGLLQFLMGVKQTKLWAFQSEWSIEELIFKL